MVHWKATDEIERDKDIYTKMWLVFMGIYFYDFLLTLWFEWRLLTRKLSFRWPYVPYLIGRYALILMFSVMLMPGSGEHEHCDGRFYILSICTGFGTGCASLNLAIRTIMIWHRKLVVAAIVTALAVGQWVSLMLSAGKFIHTGISSRFGICLAPKIYNTEMLVCYVYTLLFDLIVLAGAVAGLVKDAPETHVWRVSDIRRLVVVQGLGYFLIAAIANVFSAVFAALRLNPVMDIMLSVPAIVISTIASCHCVTGLLTYGERAPEIKTSSETPYSTDIQQLTTQFVIPAISRDVSSHRSPAIALQHPSPQVSPLYSARDIPAGPCHGQSARDIGELPRNDLAIV
ncbi:hypothetical protein NEOLEDRAFT_374017 [Neolentinus lepideus HHB14362 ss-1]|uniref:Uncharacterized protein n=1 Tax=Neolentinus lepideus HHB14362 ss-1 TaxID=1314782 RepID=A0A165SIZ2_9AGAM|nr:hypothetical protein NEOLEDRAFT_374017 [Neolentinus lepideus HHB14362 ss-1]